MQRGLFALQRQSFCVLLWLPVLMRLIIAEKPQVASAIAGAFAGPGRPDGASFRLLNGDQVTWLFGHVLRLGDPEDHDPAAEHWSWSRLPLSWPVSHHLVPQYADHVQAVVALARQAETLIHAGDPDAEGQRVVDELIDWAGLERLPCWRVMINDLNPQPVRQAFEQMQDNRLYRPLSRSVLVRAVCDQRYGYNLTRAYTLAGRQRGDGGVLSVGRVQTPMLGLVVARDRAHEQHRPHTVHHLQALLSLPGVSEPLWADWLPLEDDGLDDDGRVVDPEVARRAAEQVRAPGALVQSVTQEDLAAEVPLPYNLLTLQADAAALHGLLPWQVSEATQRLRDHHNAITYNRSDCRYLHPPRPEEAAAVLASLVPWMEQARQADAHHRGAAFDSAQVGAHHAIIPTGRVPSPSALSEAERQVYDLIARLYVGQFFPAHQGRETLVTVVAGGHLLQVVGQTVLRAGWQDVLIPGQGHEPQERAPTITGPLAEALSAVRHGQQATVVDVRVTPRQTPPPPRYRVQTLLLDLAQVAKYVCDPAIRRLLLDKDRGKAHERGGLGTPATRDALLQTLIRRGLLEITGQEVRSTARGKALCAALPPLATGPDLTALWHHLFRQIAEGTRTEDSVLAEIDAFIADEVARVRR